MKKFGTVSGVTSGRVKLKLGFEIAGGVPEPIAGCGLATAGGFGAAGFGAAGFGGDGILTCGLGGTLGFGVGRRGLVDVVVVELEELLLEELLLELLDELELDELELEELDELDGGGQDSELLATGPGRLSEDSGVPGGSWK
jgi:hypothetical protein